MPNTGQFYLLRVDGQTDEAERLLEVTAVECSCLPCGWTFNATPGHGLTTLVGGAVLACPHCGNRQAVSFVRFSEFVNRVGGTSHLPATEAGHRSL